MQDMIAAVAPAAWDEAADDEELDIRLDGPGSASAAAESERGASVRRAFQVAVVIQPVALTPCADCHAHTADVVVGPKTASGAMSRDCSTADTPGPMEP